MTHQSIIVTEIANQYNFKSGINYELKSKFGNNQLLPKSKVIGDIQYFKQNNRYIIFIINKNKDKQIATYEDTYVALMNLKDFCLKNNIIKLVMNKIGQRNKLKWDTIRAMIRYIFRETNIEILVYNDIQYTEEEK